MFGNKKFDDRKPYENNNNFSEEKGETISECPICKAPIKSIYTAIRHKDSDQLVHFDCAIRELVREYKHKLGKNLRIYYVGAGDFAIVREIYDKKGFLKTYEIIERIEYEKKDK
ncbi:MAG: hypothetical protein N2258_03755 [Brevinematales bacterium]|nr:hypothetical protein [Brevinematales bacterium]